jgi:hypothetical protein
MRVNWFILSSNVTDEYQQDPLGKKVPHGIVIFCKPAEFAVRAFAAAVSATKQALIGLDY